MAIKNLMTKSFLTRTLSGIVLILVLLLAFIIGDGVIFALTLFLSLAGIMEIYKTVGIEKSVFGITAYLAVAGYYTQMYFFGDKYMSVFIVGFTIIILAAYVFTFPKYKTEQMMMSVFGFIYVAVLMSFLFLIREYAKDGFYTVWLIIISSWGCDTCAYLAGVTMGKHKMSPVLSPKKSVEGAIGGVIGAAVIGAVYGACIGDKLSEFSNAPLDFAILCGLAALVSMIGDLAASAVKRNYGIKDYGKLIPGHGGVLDRFDSVIFTAPVIYYLITFLI